MVDKRRSISVQDAVNFVLEEDSDLSSLTESLSDSEIEFLIESETDEELYLSDYIDDNLKNIPSIEQNIKNIKVVPALKKKKVSCYENLNWQNENTTSVKIYIF